MSEQSNNKFNFEHWSMLASTAPEKFEKLRQDKIHALINKTSGQSKQRLLGLQWKIDTMRARHKNSSIAACLAISELMWETFNELAEALKLQAENSLSFSRPEMPANIISFPNKA